MKDVIKIIALICLLISCRKKEYELPYDEAGTIVSIPEIKDKKFLLIKDYNFEQGRGSDLYTYAANSNNVINDIVKISFINQNNRIHSFKEFEDYIRINKIDDTRFIFSFRKDPDNSYIVDKNSGTALPYSPDAPPGSNQKIYFDENNNIYYCSRKWEIIKVNPDMPSSFEKISDDQEFLLSSGAFAVDSKGNCSYIYNYFTEESELTQQLIDIKYKNYSTGESKNIPVQYTNTFHNIWLAPNDVIHYKNMIDSDIKIVDFNNMESKKLGTGLSSGGTFGGVRSIGNYLVGRNGYEDFYIIHPELSYHNYSQYNIKDILFTEVSDQSYYILIQNLAEQYELLKINPKNMSASVIQIPNELPTSFYVFEEDELYFTTTDWNNETNGSKFYRIKNGVYELVKENLPTGIYIVPL